MLWRVGEDTFAHVDGPPGNELWPLESRAQVSLHSLGPMGVDHHSMQPIPDGVVQGNNIDYLPLAAHRQSWVSARGCMITA